MHIGKVRWSAIGVNSVSVLAQGHNAKIFLRGARRNNFAELSAH
jgi:hypothetical protein